MDERGLDAQIGAVKREVIRQSRGGREPVPLAEAEITLRRLKTLAERLQREYADGEEVCDELAEELVAILRLPRS